jgi:hypothetical protein
MDLRKIFIAFALTALAPLAAQEPWDVHLKLTAGIMNNAVEKQLGQNRAYGLAVAGAYRLTFFGSGILEGGYKVLPTTSVTTGSLTIDDRTEIYFAGVGYRHEIWRNGVYLQGGLRASSAKTIRDVIQAWPDSSKDREKEKADRQTKLGWSFGVGFRLTDLWSIELGASNASFKNIAGEPINGTIFEVALCIHR